MTSPTTKDDETQDKRSNAQEIIKQAINSTKETRKDNECSDDPINKLQKHEIYLSINPFRNLERSSISYEEIKELVKLFQDDQQESAQTAEPKLSKEEKRKLGLNLLRILATGSKDKYNFKMQFLSALWLIENMGRQSSIDNIDQFTQFTYLKSLFGYKKDEEGNITVSEEYEEYKHIIDLIINNSQNYSGLENPKSYLKYITQIEKGKITEEIAKNIFMLGNLAGVQDVILLEQKKLDLEKCLFFAAQKGYSKVVELLLAQEGINFNATDNIGITPLIAAAQNGHVNIGTSLRIHGATPLHLAAAKGNLDVVKLLVENGANINQGVISSIISHVVSEKEKALAMFKIVIDNTNSNGIDIDLNKVFNIAVDSMNDENVRNIKTEFMDLLGPSNNRSRKRQKVSPPTSTPTPDTGSEALGWSAKKII